MSKLPAYLWYTGDWWKSTDVRMCSLAARGLWRDMLDLMHDNVRRGYLQLANGEPMTAEHIAAAIGASSAEVSSLLMELKKFGVYSCTGTGVIFSRRMVRDDSKRRKAVEFGKLGGNPKLKGGLNPPAYPRLEDEKKVRPKGRTHSGLFEDGDELPESLKTPEFIEAYKVLKQYRTERRGKKLTPTGEQQQLKKFSEWGSARACAAIYHSIANNWQGVFEPNGQVGGVSNGKRFSRAPTLIGDETV